MRKFELINDIQLFKDFRGYLNVSNELCIEGIRDSIIIPKRATRYSAGYDIHSTISFVLEPGEEIKFPTGLKVAMNPNDFLAIFPRSGSGFKFFARLANTVGIIDSDYYSNPKNDGHVFVKLRNEGDKTWQVKAGDAVCQGIFMTYLVTDDDHITEKRQGGFGSTGG